MFLLMFLRLYAALTLNLLPVIGFLMILIVLLGMRMARLEGWSRSRGLYCAFITATTVGYGEVHPTLPRTRALAIVIAFLGLILTGILVALAINSVQIAARETGGIDRLTERLSSAGFVVPAED